LIAAGPTFNDDLVNQAMAQSAIFTSTWLTLWQRIHTMWLARESSTDPNAPLLEDDFWTCLAENFPMPYPTTHSSTLDHIWNLCHVQQGLLFHDRHLPDQFSHYYNDINCLSLTDPTSQLIFFPTLYCRSIPV
jgi:hypothetical protein